MPFCYFIIISFYLLNQIKISVQTKKEVIVIADFKAENSKEISVRVGQRVFVSKI
jgi:hypothetical protein